jgi:hypothetical protein
MTGPAELLFSLSVWSYRLLFVVALWFVLKKGKNWKWKFGGAMAVIVLFTAPIWPIWLEKNDYKNRYAKAKAVFDERCKTAGEKIYRTVDDVDGILLLNVRPPSKISNYYDPNWPDAGLPREADGDFYIRTFLSWEHQRLPYSWNEKKLSPQSSYQARPLWRGYLNSSPTDTSTDTVTYSGFTYVDVKGLDGEIFRYRFVHSNNKYVKYELLREPLQGKSARYAVSYQNIVEPSDRAHWVAGTTVIVTDTVTHEIIAEKTWYAFEPGLGSQTTARTPWISSTIQCPKLSGPSSGSTRYFVDRVLNPKQEK